MRPEGVLHVVFGYGQIGSLVAQELVERGHRVRVVTRSPVRVLEPIEHMAGDAADERFAREAMRGAAVAYHCINVPYQQWFEVLPRITASLRAAARSNGTRVVVLDNLYMLGRPDAPMTEDTPLAPRSRKGELRARLEGEWLAAREQDRIEVAIGRASDFFGPGVTSSAIFLPRNLQHLRRGKPVDVGGDPDAPHSYSYSPDVAEGLATLGTTPSLPSPVWHLPITFQGTTRELFAGLGRVLGVQPRVRRMPGWMWTAASLFSPLVREAKEMVYQWEGPFVVDDSRFRKTFGVEPTPLAQALFETAAWIRETYPA